MATDDEAILGIWRLEKWEVERNGAFQPRGVNAQGLLIYASSGHMSVTMTSDAPAQGDDAPKSAPPMIFYAGTYELKDNQMLHRAEMSFDPKNFRNVRRRVELNGDTLVLRTPAEDARQVRMTWSRVAGPPA
jgi:hypothetical protein